MSRPCANCDALRAQNAELQDEARAWREYARDDAPAMETLRLRETLKIAPAHATMLALMCRRAGRVVPFSDLIDATRGERSQKAADEVCAGLIKVQMCHLRRRLKAQHPDLAGLIKSAWGVGYYIDTDNAAKLITIKETSFSNI